MTAQALLLCNITSENRTRKYFLKCVVNLVPPSILVVADRNCGGSRCLLGLVTQGKSGGFSHFVPQAAVIPAESPVGMTMCVYI